MKGEGRRWDFQKPAENRAQNSHRRDMSRECARRDKRATQPNAPAGHPTFLGALVGFLSAFFGRELLADNSRVGNVIPSLEAPILESLCKELGEMLTGSEITRLFNEFQISDLLGPESTKWKRLHAALEYRQKRDRSANAILAFLQRVLAPVRYRDNPRRFDEDRESVNAVLRFGGVLIDSEGQLRPTERTTTVSASDQRARRLRATLMDRNIHGDVLAACRAELLEDNYFHAVLEATKSLASKVRRLSGLDLDGARLIDAAFLAKSSELPLLAFNKLETQTEKSEQRGWANMMKGIFEAFRNPTAHEPRITWTIDEKEAIEILSFLSVLHRRVETATPTGGSAT